MCRILAVQRQHYTPPTLRLSNAPRARCASSRLAENADIHFVAGVQALVAELDSDPVALFNYVHDRIDTELYYGSKKGSTGTLYELAGNDADQASLLIALYRAARIPARYAYGRVWLSAGQIRDLARTTTARAAADALTSAGIPAVYVNRPGQEPVVEIEHAWVRAWPPYERYRGAAEGAASASAWIDLGPFIKRYSFYDPLVEPNHQFGRCEFMPPGDASTSLHPLR